MAINREDFKNQLAQHLVWDPTDNGPEHTVTFDADKFDSVVGEMLRELGFSPDTADRAKSEVMPPINTLFLLYEKMKYEDYLSIMDGEKDDRGKYYLYIKDSKKFFEDCKEITEDLYKRSTGNMTSKTDKIKLKKLPKGSAAAVDSILNAHNISSFEDIVDAFEKIGAATPVGGLTKEEAGKIKEEAARIRKEFEASQKEAARLQEELSKAVLHSYTSLKEVEITGDGSYPNGKVTTKAASEIFDVKLAQDFELPFWEWDDVHPDVPQKDPNYIFRPVELLSVLYAIVTNKRAYLQGHTGSGKTTLIEQVAAHLNWPFIRINFDSEITRMDLIGRDTLSTDKDGNTVSTFIDGILPRAMGSAYICCFDEIDFARPDVAYVMQAALEGNGLRITEDGDRVVQPDPYFRMFGTGNTVGQGDEEGMYQGARAQSLAFLDRFTVWIKVDYLSQKQREDLVLAHYPSLSTEAQKQLSKYVSEHLQAFTSGEVLQPISPRGMLAVAQATVILGDLKEALNMTILNRANRDDYTTLKGLIDRVVK